MAENVENHTLVLLRRIDEKMDRVITDVQDLKFRIGSVEQQMVHLQGSVAHLSLRMDRFDDRLGRIEKRLDLVEA